MKSSCIPHPENEPLIIIRKWQLEFCEGDKVAAALLSFFEYWHNIKLEMQTKNRKMIKIVNRHGEETDLDVTLYQHHTIDELCNGVMNIAKSKNTVKKSLEFLTDKGVISVSNNPNPRFNFDRTRHFLFHPEVCKQFLTHRWVKNDPSSVKFDPPSVKNDLAIPETTTEITTEITNRDVVAAINCSREQLEGEGVLDHLKAFWKECSNSDIDEKTCARLPEFFDQLQSANENAVLAVKYAIHEYHEARNRNKVKYPVAYMKKIAIGLFEHLEAGGSVDEYTDYGGWASGEIANLLAATTEQLQAGPREVVNFETGEVTLRFDTDISDLVKYVPPEN